MDLLDQGVIVAVDVVGCPAAQAAYLQRARDAAAAVTLTEDERRGLQGPAIGEKLREKRLAVLAGLKASATDL